MKLENMNQEFPKMPDAMRKMIEQEVEQQLQKKTGKFKTYAPYPILSCVR